MREYHHQLPDRVVISDSPTITYYVRGRGPVRKISVTRRRRIIRRWRPVTSRGSLTTDARFKARGVLMQHLTPQQWRQFERFGYVEETGRRTGHRYRIRNRGGVYDEFGYHHCIVSRTGEEPPEDELLSVLLMIRHDENRFLKTAIRSRSPHRAPFGFG